MALLDLFFPKTCVGCSKMGSYLCEGCLSKVEYLREQICPYCYRKAISGKTHPSCQRSFGLDGVISLTNYRTPIRELVQALKYRFTTSLLTETESKLNFFHLTLPEKEWVLTSLPLHKERENYRGFNQADLLARIFAEKLKLSYKSGILEKITATKSQVGLRKSERERNVKASFRVGEKLPSGKFFIFDDVWTSGASLKEAARVLKRAGAKEVWGLTLAHPR